MYAGKLQLSTSSNSVVNSGAKKLYYFVRSKAKITSTNIATSTQHGTLLHGMGMQSLLVVVGRVFAPQVLESKAWPEGVKKDLSGHLHKFLASLTESTFESLEKTVLYLPSGNFLPDIAAAAKNKELVQQLESILINWTRQIKDVVNSHDNAYHAEVSGPLEEIQFWRARTVDLSGISEQLQRSDVRRVINVLDASKSSYLARFDSLVKKIHDNSVEANDNLRFLEHLIAPCTALASADPSGQDNILIRRPTSKYSGICNILPELLGSIRMIWMLSGIISE